MTRHILVTGGTGFIGRPLCRTLLDRGDRLTVLSRQAPEQVRQHCGDVGVIGSPNEVLALAPIDAVINLAGAGIAEKRWTPARKQLLLDSRVKLTGELVRALSGSVHQPDVLVSGSAVGFYGAQGNRTVTEKTTPTEEFAHQLCAAWEAAARQAADLGTRVVISRTGPVIGAGGGFLQKMLPPFRLGVGGRLGSGYQYMPWIHRDDMVRGLIFLLDRPDAAGAYNLTAPAPATNAEFTRTLAAVLHKPTFFPVPGFVLRLLLGEMSRLILTGQKAIPKRLEHAGFQFRFPELKPALEDALR